jgi:hypothetical protein
MKNVNPPETIKNEIQNGPTSQEDDIYTYCYLNETFTTINPQIDVTAYTYSIIENNGIIFIIQSTGIRVFTYNDELDLTYVTTIGEGDSFRNSFILNEELYTYIYSRDLISIYNISDLYNVSVEMTFEIEDTVYLMKSIENYFYVETRYEQYYFNTSQFNEISNFYSIYQILDKDDSYYNIPQDMICENDIVYLLYENRLQFMHLTYFLNRSTSNSSFYEMSSASGDDMELYNQYIYIASEYGGIKVCSLPIYQQSMINSTIEIIAYPEILFSSVENYNHRDLYELHVADNFIVASGGPYGNQPSYICYFDLRDPLNPVYMDSLKTNELGTTKFLVLHEKIFTLSKFEGVIYIKILQEVWSSFNQALYMPTINLAQINRDEINIVIHWNPSVLQRIIYLEWSTVQDFSTWEERMYLRDLDLNREDWETKISVETSLNGTEYYFRVNFYYDLQLDSYHKSPDYNQSIIILQEFENYPFGEKWTSTRRFSTPWECSDGGCYNPSTTTVGYSFEITDLDENSFEISVNRIAFTSGVLTISFEEQSFTMTTASREFMFIGDATKSPIDFEINGTYTYTYCSKPNAVTHTCSETKTNSISEGWSGSKLLDEGSAPETNISAYNLILLMSISIIAILHRIQSKRMGV